MAHALIVDDSASTRESLEQLVKLEGFSTATAATMDQARAELAKQPPDVVLVDLNLPDGSGLTLFDSINGLSETPPAVVLITGQASLDSAVEALRRGVSDYLTKPRVNIPGPGGSDGSQSLSAPIGLGGPVSGSWKQPSISRYRSSHTEKAFAISKLALGESPRTFFARQGNAETRRHRSTAADLPACSWSRGPRPFLRPFCSCKSGGKTTVETTWTKI
jgi:CheY-like chemotaxis protein